MQTEQWEGYCHMKTVRLQRDHVLGSPGGPHTHPTNLGHWQEGPSPSLQGPLLRKLSTCSPDRRTGYGNPGIAEAEAIN